MVRAAPHPVRHPPHGRLPAGGHGGQGARAVPARARGARPTVAVDCAAGARPCRRRSAHARRPGAIPQPFAARDEAEAGEIVAELDALRQEATPATTADDSESLAARARGRRRYPSRQRESRLITPAPVPVEVPFVPAVAPSSHAPARRQSRGIDADGAGARNQARGAGQRPRPPRRRPTRRSQRARRSRRAGAADLPRRGGRTLSAGRRAAARVATQSGQPGPGAGAAAHTAHLQGQRADGRRDASGRAHPLDGEPACSPARPSPTPTPELFDALETDLDRLAFVLDRLQKGEFNARLPWLRLDRGRCARARRRSLRCRRPGRRGPTASCARDRSARRRAPTPAAPRTGGGSRAARHAARARRSHRSAGQRGRRSGHRARPRRRRVALAQGQPARTDQQRHSPALPGA